MIHRRAILVLWLPIVVAAHARGEQSGGQLTEQAAEGRSDSDRYETIENDIRLLRPTMQDSALALAVAMEKRSAQENLPRWTARALILQSMILEDRLAYAEALERSIRAEHIAEQQGDRLLRGGALSAQAGTLALSGQADRSIRVSMRAEQELKAARAKEPLATLRLNMAEELMILKDWERARATMRNVLDNTPTPRNAMAAHLGLGKIVRRSGGPPDQAIEQYRMAEAIAMEHSLERYYARIHSAFGNAFLVMERPDSASARFRRAIEQADARGLRQDALNARLGLAESLLAMQRFKEARIELEAVNAEVQDKPVGPLHKELYRLYSDLHKNLGEPAQALRYEELKDSAITELDMLERQRTMQQWELMAQLEQDSINVAAEKHVMEQRAETAIRKERDRKVLAICIGIVVLVLALVLWRILDRTRREKASSETILYSMLPEEIAQELKETGAARSRELDQVSVLFTDFEGFTEMSTSMDQRELMAEVDACFKAFDGIIAQSGLERIKTIGDAYMAAGGLKSGSARTALNTVLAALEMRKFIQRRYADRTARGLSAFRMRIGIHTGPVIAGVVGATKYQYDIWGDTVNTASRMESSGEVGHVNISESTYDLVKSEPGLTFTPRGKVQAKGKGEMEMYFVQLRSDPYGRP